MLGKSFCRPKGTRGGRRSRMRKWGGGRLKRKNRNTIVGGYERFGCGRVKQTRLPFPTDTYCRCSKDDG